VPSTFTDLMASTLISASLKIAQTLIWSQATK
jgi:hypothetical protein